MAHPSGALVTLRPDLGSAEEFDKKASRAGFIGLKVMPVFEVAKQSGNFGKRTIQSLFREYSTERAPGSGYQRGESDFTTDTYATQEHGFESPVDDRESAMYGEYLDAEMAAAEDCEDVVIRNHERRVAAKVFSSANISAAQGTTVAWSDLESSTPIDDIAAARQVFRSKVAIVPDTLVLSWTVFDNLLRNAQIIDRIKNVRSVNPADINLETIAAAFNIRKILVADGMRNTANAADASAVLADIWSADYVALMKTAEPGQSIKAPCFGRTMHWGEDGSRIGGVYETYREEKSRSNIVRLRMDTDEKVLFDSMCVLVDITGP